MNIENSYARRIPWWVGLLAFVSLAVLLLFFSFALGMIVYYTGGAWDPATLLASPVGLVVQVAAVSAIFSGIALIVPKLAGVPVKEWIRLTPATPAMFGFSCLGVIGLGFMVDEVTFVLYSLDPVTFSSDGLDMFNSLFAGASPMMFVLLTFVVSAGPGIGEELLFRGLLLRSFLSGAAPWGAVLFSSVFFGIIHLNALQGVGAGLIGVYLGVVAYRTGSILPAMAAHALNNFVCALFARFQGTSTSVWQEGHSIWIVAVAALVFFGALFGLLNTTRTAHVVTVRSQTDQTQ